MDGLQDGEEYWCSSASKAFNFDEDHETYLDTINSVEVFKCDVLNEESNNHGPVINLSLKSVVPASVLKSLLQEQLDECFIPKGASAEEELKLLRRHIQATLYNPAPEATALKLLQGKSPPFELFKSLDEKERLLDSVLHNGGGDAVISVLLFLKRTLTSDKFFAFFETRPHALQHYLGFLKASKKGREESLKLLRYFGRHQEALLLEFSEATTFDDVSVKKQKLKELLSMFSRTEMNINSVYIHKIQNTIKLLEFVEKEQNSLDNAVNFISTPIEVLFACCRKHSNWMEQNLTCNISPFRFSIEQQISPQQFEWTALNERTTSQAYADLESIFERVPTWHPIKSKQFHINISLEAAILRLYVLKAPISVLYLFLSKMSNTNEKVELSRRVNCTKAEIDALAGLKELIDLNQLRDKLLDRSEEKFYCDKVLKQLQNKRWSTDAIKIKL